MEILRVRGAKVCTTIATVLIYEQGRSDYATGVEETETRGVKSAMRTVALLDFFARQGGMSSLAEIQQELGYPKSSLYALLRTLVRLGWVETDPTGTLYRIGMRALLVG